MNYIYEEHLQSPRLITRKLTMDDIEPWTEFFADKEAIEYFPSGQIESDKARSQQWIAKQLDRYANNRFGLQALIDKEHNRFIGQCGLLEQQVEGKTEIQLNHKYYSPYLRKTPAMESFHFPFAKKYSERNISSHLTVCFKKYRLVE